jgi:hypothetical protein
MSICLFSCFYLFLYSVCTSTCQGVLSVCLSIFARTIFQKMYLTSFSLH